MVSETRYECFLSYHMIQIDTFKYGDGSEVLGPASSRHLARGLLSMPELRSVQIGARSLHNEFYQTLANEGASSEVTSDGNCNPEYIDMTLLY